MLKKKTASKEPKSAKGASATLDLDPDAWPKFEALVKSAAKMGHKPHAAVSGVMDTAADILADAKRRRIEAIELLEKIKGGPPLPQGVLRSGAVRAVQAIIAEHEAVIRRYGWRDVEKHLANPASPKRGNNPKKQSGR